MTEQISQEIDLQTMVENQSPALRRLVHVPTPAEQVDQYVSTAGISPAHADFAKAWGARRQQEIENFGLDHVKEKRTQNADTMKTVAEDAYDFTQAANDLCDQANRGDYESVDELFSIGADLRKQIVLIEREITKVETSEQILSSVEADPEGYFYSFFGRFPTLAERLPTLAQAVSEWEAEQLSRRSTRVPQTRNPAQQRASARGR